MRYRRIGVTGQIGTEQPFRLREMELWAHLPFFPQINGERIEAYRADALIQFREIERLDEDHHLFNLVRHRSFHHDGKCCYPKLLADNSQSVFNDLWLHPGVPNIGSASATVKVPRTPALCAPIPWLSLVANDGGECCASVGSS